MFPNSLFPVNLFTFDWINSKCHPELTCRLVVQIANHYDIVHENVATFETLNSFSKAWERKTVGLDSPVDLTIQTNVTPQSP